MAAGGPCCGVVQGLVSVSIRESHLPQGSISPQLSLPSCVLAVMGLQGNAVACGAARRLLLAWELDGSWGESAEGHSGEVRQIAWV